MIDPTDVTNFKRSIPELQEFLLFCSIVHGKTARIQARKLEAFFADKDMNQTPFDFIKALIRDGKLLSQLKKVGMGQYRKIERCFSELANLQIDLQTCAPSDLETVHGIGPKTSRYFILHSQKDQPVATLDRHVLSWLRDLGYNTPRSSPNKQNYGYWQDVFLQEAKKRNIPAADLDLKIWNEKSKAVSTGAKK